MENKHFCSSHSDCVHRLFQISIPQLDQIYFVVCAAHQEPDTSWQFQFNHIISAFNPIPGLITLLPNIPQMIIRLLGGCGELQSFQTNWYLQISQGRAVSVNLCSYCHPASF